MEIQPDNQSSPVLSTRDQSSSNTKSSSDNLYKDLAEKYEALQQLQQQSIRVRKQSNNQQQEPLSLQDELTQISGEFVNSKEGEKPPTSATSSTVGQRKTISHTPTDFSEAETSSSGFADETSNKFTQTDQRGSYLCTIADGNDCKISIYDDISPEVNTSDFTKRHEVVHDILTALKKAVNDNGRDIQLKSLEELIKEPEIKMVPLQIMSELDLTDDDRISLSSTMSELSISQIEPETIVEIVDKEERLPETANNAPNEEPILRPLIRTPLENYSPEIGKRSSSRRRKKFLDRSDSPSVSTTPIIGSPKINYSKRPMSGRARRRERNQEMLAQQQQAAAAAAARNTWDGNSVEFWSSSPNSRRHLAASPTPSQCSNKSFIEFKPSLASQGLNKLKQLDRSYAEVVRLPMTKREQKYCAAYRQQQHHQRRK